MEETEGTEGTELTQRRRDTEQRRLFFSASPCLCVRSVSSVLSVASYGTNVNLLEALMDPAQPRSEPCGRVRTVMRT